MGMVKRILRLINFLELAIIGDDWLMVIAGRAERVNVDDNERKIQVLGTNQLL
jgi:hypothetical protein